MTQAFWREHPSVDNGWTQTMSEQQILDWDTLGSGCQGGLPNQAKDWERGMTVCLEDSCLHLHANVLSGGTTMFPRIGEPTTEELTSLASPFSHQQSRSTQCDLVDVPGPHLYQLMWTSKGEFDESGPTACETSPRRSRPPWTPNISVVWKC